ncbi:phosphoribosylanthranilate isomerase [Clostridium formicaceticum]|uniref:N-(5'-phosphoribosyl)anthranilate isomerase n=1 Tax=Clostridium formicaceticum TaxID=1497 RepID=A0AAC9RIG5_9CLOT|nr:phosphoribosylanthranilate isomerase [Clostridium formicaceticum]AOY75810.1 N-(5'-phosphoribosyl)anthranilate isomerase [Clostridium formicaceticum]ARE86139.1 N-(5'-phosphoribosyl)anthranilate isomerase [Clostridium formicaceticum]
MTAIKICGLTREEDIGYVNQLKPDYVGFVFAESKRKVTKEKAKNLIQGLEKQIKTVGVFVNTSIEEVKEIAAYCDLDILQLHGEENPSYINAFSQKVWKSFRIKNVDGLKQLEKYTTEGYLLDTYVEGAYGGTGKTLDWTAIAPLPQNKPIILAGGLTPENVEGAVKILRPYAVDVSSGVESSGYKDYEKIEKFIRKVRR